MDDKIKNLYNKDNNSAYTTLLELEELSIESNALYPYFDEFLTMLNSDKTFIRVRGFRLICCLAKWDEDLKIDENIDTILNSFENEKSTAIRQYLEKIDLILMYKKELKEIIKEKLTNLDLSNHKESMQDLIRKDIEIILNNHLTHQEQGKVN